MQDYVSGGASNVSRTHKMTEGLSFPHMPILLCWRGSMAEFFEELPQALLTVHLCGLADGLCSHTLSKQGILSPSCLLIPPQPDIGVAFNCHCRDQPTRKADDVAYYLYPHSGGSVSFRIPQWSRYSELN